MSNVTPAIDATSANELLLALDEQLAARGEHHELVVIGGAALLALGLVDRVTRDIDVVALRQGDVLLAPEPFPVPLSDARDRVAADFQLSASWLNAGPGSLVRDGLPDGFVARLETRIYGAGLTVHFASRRDQIHFKLYAAVDQGPGKHESDLRALEPTRDELIAAALWTRTLDPSPGFEQVLRECLAHFGVEDADGGP
jgi:hypothetical protein